MPEQEYDTKQLDEVQHPVLGPLKFPHDMPPDERNQIIQEQLKARQPAAPAAKPAAQPPADLGKIGDQSDAIKKMEEAQKYNIFYKGPGAATTGETALHALGQAGQGLKELGTGTYGMGKDVLRTIYNPTGPTTNWFMQPTETAGMADTVKAAEPLFRKYITAPLEAEQEKAAQTTGLEHVGHAAASYLPMIGPWASSIGEQVGTGDIAGGLAKGVTQYGAGELAGFGARKGLQALDIKPFTAFEPKKLTYPESTEPQVPPTIQGPIKPLHPLNVLEGPINRSVGARVADVHYGNPAKALVDERIASPTTAGRYTKVVKKMPPLQAQLDKLLDDASVMGKTVDLTNLSEINNGIHESIEYSIATEESKTSMRNEWQALHKAIGDSLSVGEDLNPHDANLLKQKIGDAVNWTKRPSPLPDIVEAGYRKMYDQLNKGINAQVPEAKELNSRLTNLHAAQKSLYDQFLSEKAGGRTLERGAIGRGIGKIAPAGIIATQDLAKFGARHAVPLGAANAEEFAKKHGLDQK